MHAAMLEGPEKGPSRPKPSGWSATRKWLAGCAPRGRRPADLSSDGKSVLAVVQSRPPQLVIYSTGAGETQQLERGGIENYATAQWFRDGKSVLICGNEPGKRTRLYVQQIGGGDAGPPCLFSVNYLGLPVTRGALDRLQKIFTTKAKQQITEAVIASRLAHKGSGIPDVPRLALATRSAPELHSPKSRARMVDSRPFKILPRTDTHQQNPKTLTLNDYLHRPSAQLLGSIPSRTWIHWFLRSTGL
jgi:hypothetical protein